MFDDIRVDRRGDIDLITLHRPTAHNALTPRTYTELEVAVRQSTARCIVITGTDPAFCAGDDLREFMGTSRLSEYLERDSTLATCTEAFLYTNIPVVAAVNGAAVGWGMELALLADIRIASERARFGEVFALRGLCTDVPGMGLLAQVVGREHAARLLFTGAIIDAQRASDIGLVSEIVPHADLLTRAWELATTIAMNPPLAVQTLKEGLRRALDPEWRELGAWVRCSQQELARTEDHQESVRAFIEKRQATFTGR